MLDRRRHCNGIGKTSVAAEFVHRYGSFFAGGVFWLSCANPAVMASEVAACGGPGFLDLHPTYGSMKQEDQVMRVYEAWAQPIPRLLIFDNADDPQVIQRWVPVRGGCRVVITSRRQTWPASLGVTPYHLDVLVRPASVALLRDLAPHLTPAETDTLAAELGDVPLALRLAGGVLAQPGPISAAAYLDAVQHEGIVTHSALRRIHNGTAWLTAADGHGGRAVLVSHQQLDPTHDTLALALLDRAFCLAADAPIPNDVLLASADVAPDDAASQQALDRLVELGLLTRGPTGLLTHGVVQRILGGSGVATATAMAVATGSAVAASILQQLQEHQRTVSAPHEVTPLAILRPHLQWLLEEVPMENELLIRLLQEATAVVMATGMYGDAEPLGRYALALSEQHLGVDHLLTITSLHNLAWVHEAMEQYASARTLCERALLITEATLGPQHPTTAISLTSLAWICRATRDHATARALEERALGIREAVLPPTHVKVAESLHNLSIAWWNEGDVVRASTLMTRALFIYEAAFGPAHATTIYARDILQRQAAQRPDPDAATIQETQ